MLSTRWDPVIRYASAALAVGAALAVKTALAREWAVETPFLLLLGAVMFSAWSGGVGPGLAATVLAAFGAVHLFLTPPDPGATGPDLRLVQFLAEGGFISVLSGLRRQSSAEAHRRAEELRVTLASIGDGVVTADADGRVTFLNPVAERLAGCPAADAIGRPTGVVLRFVDESTGRGAGCPCAGVIQGAGRAERHHLLLVARDGSARPVEAACAPVRGLDGGLMGAVMVLRDTTEQRCAEAARVEVYRRTAAILESISDAFYALDREWRFTYVNRRAQEYLGRAGADLLGLSLWSAFPALPGSPIEVQLRAAAAGGPMRFEARSVLTDGWVEVGAYPSAEGLAVYFRDVTERVRAEEERARLVAQLEAEQDRLRAVLEQMPAGVMVATAPDGRVAITNPRVTELLPAGTHADAAALPLRRPDGSAGDWVPPVARALRGECVRAEDYSAEHPGGRVVWLRVSAAPIRDRHGAVTGAVTVFDDVTGERTAQQTLRRSHDVLLSRLATIAEEERRRLSRELHDETSQQLTGLILGLRSARDRVPAPVAEALRGLQAQAEQIGEALHRVANDLRPAALDQLGLVPALRDAVALWARRSGVRAEFYSTLGPERLPPDLETHLYRVTNEALANVLRHAAATRASVVLDGCPGDGLAVVVEDDGRGFAPEGRADGRLGIRGMRERAALLGGTVEIESRPGHGTTVFVRVPWPRAKEE
ncbi:Signal transduction histidine-protein kinase/phosphatase DegS [Gemmata obscuriglobus]|uniref:Histidine kinase n=1 Tax=Gemmata obscuriglobus TaxID=114 RepID=A0A2Z3GYG8_9BACT|nr:PAS domain-containing protein [Gemmata obscuriglobus]AWM37092.1 hypothetical protein C1280_08680 [Gemmata obscuriglobus]QEG30186.1 Signal transduction histidine-protein kinase/phosphatase DegS [Gemmata obscuriglobus]VTS09510.1 histidine kinase : Putative Sensor histidine kinase OS=Candidatus Nitrospira defluvii GN=NIDE3092 PE=4 SV=1: PAS_4: PAS_4: PAS_4: HisKA_3: HATPase_c [Gemmata obscuriglobus UQM 2246]